MAQQLVNQIRNNKPRNFHKSSVYIMIETVKTRIHNKGELMSISGKHLITSAVLSSIIGSTAIANPSPAVSTIAQNQAPVSIEQSIAEKPERLFLQQISASSAIIKWRGPANSACIAFTAEQLTEQAVCAEASNTAADHKEAHFDKLNSDTDYVYSVGNYSSPSLQFRTAPPSGKTPADGNIHVWIIGDSGTATEQYPLGNYTHPDEAQMVLDGFKKYNAENNPVNKNEAVDLFLLLGDNAYIDGTDEQWQGAVFDLYTDILSQSAVWPTIGNHEMGSGELNPTGTKVIHYPGASTTADPNHYLSRENLTPRRMPYLDIFTLPTDGNVGGVASGTEQYYSFDYGNVHFVSLDSQLSARDKTQRDAMRTWLISDLSSNQLDWTVVIFHHPPYTKGSHDSDELPSSYFGIDTPIIDMRKEFTPVFEDYGVDLVYGGHSHSYERSYYLNGHRGDADTFDAKTHTELNAKGESAVGYGEESYFQVSPNSKQDDKVVYTVAGSSGKVKLGKGKLDHPAHAVQKFDPEKRHGLAELGSVVLDASGTELTARFINEKGEIRDTVTIRR